MNLAKLTIFSNRYKTKIALGQLAIVTVILVLSVVRIFTRPAAAPRSRASTMSLGMAAKSLVLLVYELLTEHVNFFKKWASYKAYFIINALEVVFWGAVVFLIIQSSIQFCESINCTLGWVVVALAIILNIAANHVAVICFIDWRYHKRTGKHRPAVYSARDYKMENGTPANTHRRHGSSSSSSSSSSRRSQTWLQPSPGFTAEPSVMEQGLAGPQKSASYVPMQVQTRVQTRGISSRSSQTGLYPAEPAQPATFHSQATNDSRGRYGSVHATTGHVHSQSQSRTRSRPQSHSRSSSHGNSQHHHSSSRRSRRNSVSHGQGRTRTSSRVRVRESSVVRHQNLQLIRGGGDYQVQQQQSVPLAQVAAQSPWTPLGSEQYHGELPVVAVSPYDAPPACHSQTAR